MPTLYNFSVQVDTEVEVDIDLELQEIADLIEDEMGEFIAAHASASDIWTGITDGDYTLDIFDRLMLNMDSESINHNIKDFCRNYTEQGENLKAALRTWIETDKPTPEPTPEPIRLTNEELATLESARRAVSAISHLTLVEGIIQRNYAPGNAWLDTLNNLDALLAKLDTTKKDA